MTTEGSILILTYWAYRDALIQTYTLPYVMLIRKRVPSADKIYLVTFENDSAAWLPGEKARVGRDLALKGIEWLAYPYRRFGLLAMGQWAMILGELALLIKRRRISTIHAWCTPPGVAGYVLSMLTSRRLIIDSYEPHAESMVENGTWSGRSFAFKLLFRLEKLQSRRAQHLIACTDGMRGYALAKYGYRVRNFHVKPACVNFEHFDVLKKKDENLLRHLQLENKVVAIYAGKVGGIYLSNEIFDLMLVALEYWGEDRFRFLLLTNHPESEIEQLCRQAGIPRNCIIQRFVPHDQIPSYLGLADFAISPVKPVPSKRFCSPIKDGEYWAMGLPVIIPRGISDDSDIIEQHQIGAVLNDFSRASYLEAIRTIDALLQRPNETSQKIANIARKYRGFEIAENVYARIYGEFN